MRGSFLGRGALRGLIAAKNATRSLRNGLNRVRSMAARAGKAVKLISLAGLGAGGLAGFAIFKGISSIVDVAAAFERYESILKTVEGSSEKARRSMEWIKEFTAKTPFQLKEVAQAFVKMRTIGLDPMNGSFKVMGDTAAAMGKSIDQVVEALADVSSGGGFERLKELGITGGADGKKAVFEFTNSKGEREKVSVDKSDRLAQVDAVLKIWESRFAGAMDDMSSTWLNMMSNLKDSITNFKNDIANAGLFDHLKDRLKTVLDTINKMKSEGTLDAWAKSISDGLVAILKTAEDVGFKLFDWAKTFSQSFNLESLQSALDNVVTSMQSFIEMINSLASSLNSFNEWGRDYKKYGAYDKDSSIGKFIDKGGVIGFLNRQLGGDNTPSINPTTAGVGNEGAFSEIKKYGHELNNSVNSTASALKEQGAASIESGANIRQGSGNAVQGLNELSAALNQASANARNFRMPTQNAQPNGRGIRKAGTDRPAGGSALPGAQF